MADLESALMSRWFTQLLEQFLLVNPVAQVTLLEIGFRLAVPQSTSIRRPDMGLILNSNPVQMALTDHNYQGIFDICIEFLSHSSQKDIHRDTIQKKGEYEQAGVQEYYILDGRGIETAFYEQTASGVYRPLPQPGGMMQSQALAGFRFRINDLYHRPPLMSLVDDPVYQGFVLRDYQAERTRANQEQQRADQEQQRADHAEHKIFDIVRRTVAFRFQLPLDHFDQELQGLDVSALTVLSDALFEVADLAEFKAQLAQFVSSKK